MSIHYSMCRVCPTPKLPKEALPESESLLEHLTRAALEIPSPEWIAIGDTEPPHPLPPTRRCP